MSEAMFWSLVDSVHDEAGLNMTLKDELLATRLAALSDADLGEFYVHWHSATGRANDHGLWAAAYVIEGGCSDDSFMDFRATLVGLGRTTYEAALRDPETLLEAALAARAAGADLCHESHSYIVSSAAERLPDLDKLNARVIRGSGPTGEDWDEDGLPERLPALWREFGDR